MLCFIYLYGKKKKKKKIFCNKESEFPYQLCDVLYSARPSGNWLVTSFGSQVWSILASG